MQKMLFRNLQPKTDYIVIGKSECPLATGDIFFIDAMGDLLVRNTRHMIGRNEWPNQIPADLEIREFTNDEYFEMLKEQSYRQYALEDVAKSVKQTALNLAREFRKFQIDQALLYFQISEWLQELKILKEANS